MIKEKNKKKKRNEGGGTMRQRLLIRKEGKKGKDVRYSFTIKL